MNYLSVSIPGYFIAQGIANNPILGASTFAVDHITDFVMQQVWPSIESNAKQFAIPVKVVASYVLATAFQSQDSLLLSYGLYALAKTMTNCTHFVLSRDTLPERLNTIGIVACASLAISATVFLATNAMGCPLSFNESILVSGCVTHWISRSAPDLLEHNLNTVIQF